MADKWEDAPLASDYTHPDVTKAVDSSQSSNADYWKREAGLKGRDLANVAYNAVASPFGVPVADAMGSVLNAPLRAYDYMKGNKEPSYRFPSLMGTTHNQEFNNFLTSNARLPNPETTPEKIGSFITQLGVGGILGGKAQNPLMESIGFGNPPTSLPVTKTLTPTAEKLKDLSQSAYRQAEEAGVVISNDSYGGLVRNIRKEMVSPNVGFNEKLLPKTAAVLDEVTAGLSKPRLTLTDLEVLRRQARIAAGSTDAGEANAAHHIIDTIDEYVSGLSQKDLAWANHPDLSISKISPEKATSALTDARSLWSRSMKADTIDWMAEKVKNRPATQSYEAAMRGAFRPIANSQRKMKMFSQEEQDAINKLVRGGDTENSLSLLSGLMKGVKSGVMSMGSGYFVGNLVGGPAGGAVGAATAAGLGGAGHLGANALAAKHYNALSELVRRGTSAPEAVQSGNGAGQLLGAIGSQSPGFYNWLMQKTGQQQ